MMSPSEIIVPRSVVTTDDYSTILLLQRAGDSKKDPKFWELPGGKLDPYEDIEAGLIREIKEETGLRVVLESPLQYLPERRITDGERRGQFYRAVGCIACVVGGEIELSSKHSKYKWSVYASALEMKKLTSDSQKVLTELQDKFMNQRIRTYLQQSSSLESDFVHKLID